MYKSILNKVFLLVILLGLVCANDAYSQRWRLLRYQVGGSIGTAQIFGDIGGTASEKNWFGLRDISFKETGLSYGLNVRYRVKPAISVKANFYSGKSKGDDLDSRNDRGRSYVARLFEGSAQFEYYFLSEDRTASSGAMYNRRGMVNNYSTLSSYGFGGLGFTYSSVKFGAANEIPGVDKYKPTNGIPVALIGVGVKYLIDDRWHVEGEFGYRYAFNDFVEGFSQVLSSKHNDLYYFFMFSIQYKLRTSRRGLPSFLDRKFRYSI